MQHHITYPFLLLLMCALCGCSGVREHILSRPNGQDNVAFNRSGLAKFDQLELRIRPTNGLIVAWGTDWVIANSTSPFSDPLLYSPYYRSTPTSPITAEPFIMEVFVKAEKDISIKVQKFLLITAGGRVHKPSHYYFPLKVGSTQNYFFNLCEPNKQAKSNPATLIQIGREKIVCFAIAYDVTPPPPGENFRIEIDGLTDKDGEIKMRPLLFVPSKETYYHP